MEPGNTPRWIALSLALPVFLIFMRPVERPTVAHWLGVAWLAWLAVTLLWSHSFYDGVIGLWRWLLIGMALYLGSSMTPRNMAWSAGAFAAGIALNGGLALGQSEFPETLKIFWLEYVQQTVLPAGTYANKNYLAEAALVGLVLAFTIKPIWLRYGVAACCALGWVLPLSRGALLAGAVVAVLWLFAPERRYRQLCRLSAIFIVVVATIGFTAHFHGVDLKQSSFGDRVAFYANSLVMIGDNPFGQGVGNFWAAYPLYHDALIDTPSDAYRLDSRPRTAHNDLLTLTAETGIIGGIILVAILLLVIYRSRSPYRYALFAVLTLGAFNFPLYLPVTGFMAGLVAGNMLVHKNHDHSGAVGRWCGAVRRHGLGRLLHGSKPNSA